MLLSLHPEWQASVREKIFQFYQECLLGSGFFVHSLYVPRDFLKSLLSGQKQRWEFKPKRMENVSIFKLEAYCIPRLFALNVASMCYVYYTNKEVLIIDGVVYVGVNNDVHGDLNGVNIWDGIVLKASMAVMLCFPFYVSTTSFKTIHQKNNALQIIFSYCVFFLKLWGTYNAMTEFAKKRLEICIICSSPQNCD